MTPASSVLLLTTLTGFGYGLLAWLGIFCAAGALPESPWFGPVAVVIALGFAGAGLVASTLHLGRKERAWRAFSQWRSSWLSREGVAAVATNLPALGFAVSWAALGAGANLTVAFGLVAAAMALGTVFCTAMIYACLKPIRQWHNRFTAPLYLVFAAFSGAALLAALLGVWTGAAAGGTAGASALVVVFAIGAGVAKAAYWRFIDAQGPLATLASATGLGSFGTVRALDRPHFTENYVLREMGYQIARRHAARLRRIVLVLAFAAPAVLAALALAGAMPAVAAPLAALLAGIGLFAERWLFFAEATHVSAIYYGRAV
ncbi:MULTISPECIES: DmsC/YnfH family molybdoenzyme membrane anchor subunit [unclassified Acidiphilium]|uniref:dimethyl sulfoxide reductase anchor subunit family protein n=1 Tax=unclassified Acidiphilium TaxID=2617493 RepID=UPI000BD72EB3|nr:MULTISPECIES: DmsC/YnfH family molybdoenzyme membrane anchor subunit [unclassified Acidiphilium]OYV55777.1 MAG: DMSO reductase [Acidiphilium sp. 20-67-58]HQT60271.1 dimethyl sulfoxide reductase anchor subunit [Acidiphilium sp.]